MSTDYAIHTYICILDIDNSNEYILRHTHLLIHTWYSQFKWVQTTPYTLTYAYLILTIQMSTYYAIHTYLCILDIHNSSNDTKTYIQNAPYTLTYTYLIFTIQVRHKNIHPKCTIHTYIYILDIHNSNEYRLRHTHLLMHTWYWQFKWVHTTPYTLTYAHLIFTIRVMTQKHTSKMHHTHLHIHTWYSQFE